MKKRYFVISLILAILLFTGCDNFKAAIGMPGHTFNSKKKNYDDEYAEINSRSEYYFEKDYIFDINNFYEVCAFGSKEQVEKAINSGASVNAVDTDGYSPLFHAILAIPKMYSENLSAIQTALKKDDDNALYEALAKVPCRKGNLEAVKILLKNGANVQLTDRKKNTAFLYACMFCSDVNILKALTDAGADIQEKLSANYPQSLLTFASFINTTPECVKYIANLGKNIGEKNQFGTTPIMWAAMYNSNPEVIDALIDAGADINDPSHKDGYSPLHWAVRCNRNSNVAEHIIELGADINKEDKYGSTPLLWAVCNNNPKDVVEIMERAFNDINYFYSKNLPDYFANFQQSGKPELVPLLLNHTPTISSIIEAYSLAYCLSSADIANSLLNKIDSSNSVSFDNSDFILMCCSKDEKKISALKNVLIKHKGSVNIDATSLITAVAFENSQVINVLTEELGVSVDYDTAKTIIYRTSKENLLNPVIKSCKNVNKQNYYGQTLLNYAVEQENLAAVKALIANDAKIDMRYGDNYFTELMTAVNKSYPNNDIVRALIKAGADVNARDKNGASVLIYAVNKNSSTSTAEILINAGADQTAKYKDDYVYEYSNNYIKNTSLYRKLKNAVSYGWW